MTVVDDDGDQRRLVEGLASIAAQGTGESADGPHGIYVKSKNDVLVTNGGPLYANRDELAAQNPVAELFGRVLRIDRGQGHPRERRGHLDFERDNNPHAVAVDSNAVDVLVDCGRLVVADAGGNTLLKVKKNGTVQLLSVFWPTGSSQTPSGRASSMQTAPRSG